jgi:exopolysaccharide biosynthesis polyprenyl glycosylphosphotransferase
MKSSQSNGPMNGKRPEGQHLGGRWVQLVYAFIDICCIVASGVGTFSHRFLSANLRGVFVSGHLVIRTNQPLSQYGGFLLLYVTLVLLFCEWQDLYRTPRERSAPEESFAVVKAVSLATLFLSAILYLCGIRIVSRAIVLESLLLNITSLAAWRYVKRRIVIRRVEQGINSRNVAIIGAGTVGRALAHQIERDKHLGYRFMGFLDENHSQDPRILGKIEDLVRVSQSHFLDEVFITIPSDRELVKRLAVEAQRRRLAVKVVPELYDGLGWHAPIDYIGEFPLMGLHWLPTPTLGFFVKRVFDFIVSLLALIISCPILAVSALSIKLDSPGPVFYRSKRIGKKGCPFVCYKLRTMVANADDLKDSLRYRNERLGPFFKIEDDPRITRLGRFLRKYSLDELPQLWNVLKGDMSLVGPRPHPVDDFEQYSIDQLCRLEAKPGITGLWQVMARNDPSFETNMQLDLEYIENWNLWLDLKILGKTIPAVFQGAGR